MVDILKLYQNLLFGTSSQCQFVEIGRAKDIGIAIEVDSSFLQSTGSEWAKRKHKAVSINVSRMDQQFATPHEWSQFTDLSDSEEEEGQETKEQPVVDEASEEESNVIDHD